MIENLCDNVLFFNFAIEMKKWLKYLIPILVIVASLGATCKYNISSQDTLSCFFPTEEVDLLESSSSIDSSFGLQSFSSPRPVRIQGNNKRIDSKQKQTFKYIQPWKSFNISVIHHIPSNTILKNTTIIEYAHKLVFLGRLII